MDTYIREIIHFEVLSKEIIKSEKEFVAYYKYEKRKGRCKIVLSIDGIKLMKEQTYVFCLVYKINQKSFIREVRTLKLTSSGRIDEKIQVEDIGEGHIIGAVIFLKGNKSTVYNKQAVLVGYQKEKFDLGNLIEANKQNEKINNNNIEINNNNIEINSININNTDDKEIIKEEPIGIEEKKDLKNKESNERYTNTLEYIKDQLEKNEDLKVIDEIYEKKQRIEPFNEKDSKTEWVQIDITDLVFLPLESWLLMNNAFLMNSYRKYKHLILGRNKEEGILKLGVPDVYYFKESLIANICGFNEFYTCSCGTIKSGEYGYWVIKTTL